MKEITLAWIKGKRTNGLRKLSDKKSTFVTPNIKGTSPYDGDLKLEQDEWFCIENFSRSKYAIDLISKDEDKLLASTMISKNEFENIKYLVHYIDTGIYMFQAVLKSRTMENRKLFSFKQQPEIIEDSFVVIIQELPDAVYNKNEDRLYFRDLGKITHIFPNVGELYREATDDEVKDFLSADFLNVHQDFSFTNVSVPNRKKIALFGKVYQGLNNDQKKDFKQYLKKYKPNFQIDEREDKDIFSIGTDEDIRNLLSACAERFYTTPITGKPLLARSVQSVINK